MTPPLRRLAAPLAVLAAAAAWSGSALAASGPSNTEPPTIDTGRPQAGTILVADHGTWTGSPTGYAYQWQQCNGSGAACVDIPGATGVTYTVRAADAGGTLVVVVTASNASGDGTATSDPTPIISTFLLSTAHFVVHYVSDPSLPIAITQTQAGDIAARAERAYTAELADGYPAPLSDGTRGGDSRIDIYVNEIGLSGVLGYAVPETLTPQTYGYIVLEGSTPTESFTLHTIAHEIFHLVQFGIWRPATVSEYWLLEGSAEWMGYRVDGFEGDLDLGLWDIALDCRDPKSTAQCDLEDPYKNGGYSRWPFFEFVAERWGTDFTRSIFGQGAAANGTALNAVAAAIAGKGSSLADVFTDWSVANMTGSYAAEALQNVLPPVAGSPISTGTLSSLNAKAAKGAARVTSGPLTPVTVSVNHLSARYVALRAGNQAFPDAPCYKATLDLTVTLPAGVGARPSFWWSAKNPDGSKQAARAFSVSGTTATLSVPWDTCDWGSARGYISLANSSTTLDGQDFKVGGSLTIDAATQTTATPPPDPVSTAGAKVVDADSDAPRIDVFGPQLIRISSTARVLRVVVSASDSGLLRASLGSLALGTGKLRPGSNDLRFALPDRALKTLRTTSAASNTLTLTPVSTSGSAGKPIVRKVTIERVAAKPKPKAKAKAKR